MKYFLSVLGLALLSFSPDQGSAQVICYQGTSKEVTVGSDSTARQNYKLFVVVDHDTTNLGEVTYTIRDGRKVYYVSSTADFHIVTTTAGRQLTNSTISRPPSECETNCGITAEHIFASGTNMKLVVNTNATISFPRTLTYSETSLLHIGDPDKPYLFTASRIFNFDQKRTLAANAAGATLEETIAKFIAFLESLGYANGNAP